MPSYRCLIFSLSSFFCGFHILFSQTNEELAKSIIVVVNRNAPESLEIAQYYTQQRGIPESNIIHLYSPNKETISLKQYVETIANPLLNALLDTTWLKGIKSGSKDLYGRERVSASIHSIPYVVLIRGVPLRIANDPNQIKEDSNDVPPKFYVNNGSVDTEVALLLAPPDTTMTAYLPNPYYDKKTVSDTYANRVLKVSRLDGPTKSDVLRLIDRTLEAEKVGLLGRVYIDTGGPHKKGDEWIRSAGVLAEKAYFDVDYESSKRLIDFCDRLDAPAIYMGWYRQNAYGQWVKPKWPVPPGAIGFHLHSFSATSVRDPKTWLGAFVAQGYCATIGNVYEPYLEFTHRPHILLEHLINGGNFGDAVMLSMPSLSWQSVAIGDPLYRPFKVGLDEQLKQTSSTIFGAYPIIREINRLLVVKGSKEAIIFGRSKFISQPSLALAYRLAILYSNENQVSDAIEVLRFVRFTESFSIDEIVLVQKIANFLNKHAESELALNLYSKVLCEPGLDKELLISLYQNGARIADSLGKSFLASRWSLEARKLKSSGKVFSK